MDRRIRLVPCDRAPRVPIWALAIVLAWGTMIVTAHVVARLAGADASMCVLRRVTGIPCPTCGATRGVLRIADGEVLRAFATNPGVFLGFVVGGGLLVLRLAAARRVELSLSPRVRRVALALATGLVLANWAYLIVRGI